MKYFRIFIILSILCTVHHRGKGEVLYLSPSSVGRGGSFQSIAEPGIFFHNPAIVSLIGNWSWHAGYGFSNSASISSVEIIFPLPPLFWAASFATLFDTSHHSDFSYKSTIGSVGCGGDIIGSLWWGASLQFSQIRVSESWCEIASRLGIFWQPLFEKEGTGFGIYSINVGFSHVEPIFTDENSWFFSRESSLGVGMMIFRSSNMNIRLVAELSAMWQKHESVLKGGCEIALCKNFFLRCGALSNFLGTTYVMGGIGGSAQLTDHEIRCDYSLAHQGNETIHYVSANVRFTGMDSNPPRVRLAVDHSSFSPNGDGKQDEMIFHISAYDESKLKGWVLQILNQKGQVVKEFKSKIHSPLTKFLISPLSIFSRNGSVAIPRKLYWDGTDQMGKVKSDGEYYYSFYAWDEHDNISPMLRGRCILDTVPPKISIRAAQLICVPGKSSVEVAIDFMRQPSDKAWAILYDKKGREIITWQFPDGEQFGKIVWDGIDFKGKAVENGFYTLRIVVHDDAGNSADHHLNNVIVTNDEFVGDLVLDRFYFSPQKDGFVKFVPKLIKKLDCDEWKVIISDEKGETVYQNFGKGLPSFYEWDGANQQKRLCKDGRYFINLYMLKGDAVCATLQKTFVIDTTPPRSSINVSLQEFTPDDDYYRDEVFIYPRANDTFAIDGWEIYVYGETGELVKKFSGKGNVPKCVRWNGRIESGSIPFTFEKFEAQLRVWDKSGNESITPKKGFSTGIVLMEEGNQKHIVFPYKGIRRKGDDALLARFLFSVENTLRLFRPSKVEIEVHSDLEGDDETNLLNTEKIAAYAKDFLIKEGIDEKIISFRGMGETKALYSGTAEKLRYKNDRIEIFLTLTGE